MGALVLRVVATGTFYRTEYLSRDGLWVERSTDAEIFPTHAVADEVAKGLRANGEDHAHAAVLERPAVPPPPARRSLDNAPADFVMPPRPAPRKTRAERQAARAAELREENLREIEASYAE